jgi:uncharacterized protein
MNAITTATSDANVKQIGEVYAAFGRGDMPFILANLAPDALWDFNVKDSDVPWHVAADGAGEVPNLLGALMTNVAMEAFEPKQFIASGDEVIAYIRIAYVVGKTGIRVDQEQLHWWTVKGGRITRLRHFEDTAQVIAAWRGR